jgi:maltose-binding protein MalE
VIGFLPNVARSEAVIQYFKTDWNEIAVAITNNPALRASMEQIQHGRPMPIVPQMRQIEEGIRGPYQLVMNGVITAGEAAHRMQCEAEKNIADSDL